MAHYLPPAIMRFFQPRPGLEIKPAMKKRKMPDYSGVAGFVHRFTNEESPKAEEKESAEEKAVRKKARLTACAKVRMDKHIAKWDPRAEDTDSIKTAEPYKTLFIARLAYEFTDVDLKEEFEYYGPVTKVRIVKDRKTAKKQEPTSRGYGFIEFESSRDLKEAYKDADGRKIAGRRILVDVERGRTVKNWQPRRLGGGLGGTRIGGEDVNQKFSGREPPRADGGGAASHSSRSSRDSRDSRDSGRDRGRDRDRDRRGGGGGGGGRDRDRDRDRDRRR